VDAPKLAEVQKQRRVRNGQALAIKVMVCAGLLSAAQAEAKLMVLVAKGSPKAEVVLLRITRQQAQ
jgi:hypothetical protein